MNIAPDLDQFHRQLAETIAWCHSRVDRNDLANCLRSPALWPENRSKMPDEFGRYEYRWDTIEENDAVMSSLAKKRSALLLAHTKGKNLCVPGDLAGGRILVVSPEDSDAMDLSLVLTEGFIDEFDVPAWDTWIGYFGKSSELSTEESLRFHAENGWGPPKKASCLLCWIPKQLLELVNEAVIVNSTSCLIWADDLKSRKGSNVELLRGIDLPFR